MSIEGIPQAEALRDFLYSKMRGARGLDETTGTSDSNPLGSTAASTAGDSAADEALVLLREIRDAFETAGGPTDRYRERRRFLRRREFRRHEF